MFVDSMSHAYNMAPTIIEVVIKSAFWFDNGRGYIDLSDLNAQNVIQHDASFTRPDIAYWPDQSKPHPETIDLFLARASDRKHLSISDIAYHASVRRAECRATNGQFAMDDMTKKFFGDMNATLMWSVFGGRKDDLEIWLKEERFPDGWEPRNRQSYGYAIGLAEAVALTLEFNINEKTPLRSGDAYITDQFTASTGPPSFVNGNKRPTFR